MAFPVILGAVASAVTGILGGLKDTGIIKDKQAEQQVELALNQGLLEFAQQQEASYQEHMRAQRDVIMAEASGQSWMQRNWRPLLMLTFTAILAWNYLLGEIFSAITGQPHVVLEFPERFWGLLQIGVGGYIVGRTAEKKGTDWLNAWRGNE